MQNRSRITICWYTSSYQYCTNTNISERGLGSRLGLRIQTSHTVPGRPYRVGGAWARFPVNLNDVTTGGSRPKVPVSCPKDNAMCFGSLYVITWSALGHVHTWCPTRSSLGTNVNTPFFQGPTPEFGYGVRARVQGRDLVLRRLLKRVLISWVLSVWTQHHFVPVPRH